MNYFVVQAYWMGYSFLNVSASYKNSTGDLVSVRLERAVVTASRFLRIIDYIFPIAIYTLVSASGFCKFDHWVFHWMVRGSMTYLLV